MNRRIQICTAALCLLFLLAGLARALLSPETEIAYENRPARRWPAFSAGAFLRGDYQAAAEDALADQQRGLGEEHPTHEAVVGTEGFECTDELHAVEN